MEHISRDSFIVLILAAIIAGLVFSCREGA